MYTALRCKTFEKTFGIFLVLLCFSSICHASSKNPHKMITYEGAYKFHTSYKLQKFSGSNNEPSELLVKAHIGRDPVIVKHLNARALPGRFGVRLSFNKNSLEMHYDHKKINELDADISHPESRWDTGLEYLIKKIGAAFYKSDTYGKKHHPKNPQIPHLPHSFQIQPVGDCRLDAEYSIHIPTKVPQSSALAQRVIVDVTTQEKSMKRFNGEKRLVVIASFYVQKRPQLGDSKCVIKFLKNKNGLQKIASKNSRGSTVWQPWVKKVCERSVRKYLQCKRLHEKVGPKDARTSAF